MVPLRIDSPVRLTVAYLAFGTVWILGRDALVAGLGLGHNTHWPLSVGHGLVFVAVTAILLYVLSARLVRRHTALELELQKHQRRWRFALESAGTGTWEWNEVTGEVHYSHEWKAMLGYADDEIGRGKEEWLDRIHPDDGARVRKEMDRHTSGETPVYECEFRMRTKTGAYRWILARGLVVSRQDNGKPWLAFGTHTDITVRKHAESRVADALAFVRAMLSSSPAGIIAYDPTGRAVIANEPAARMVGTDVPGLLKQNYRELESWRQSGLLAAAERALATGKPALHEGMLATSFGRTLWISAHLVPFDYLGSRHLLLMMSDETDKRRASDELHMLHAALQAAPSSWIITNADGVIEWVNPAFTRMTGYAAGEAIGQTPRLLQSGRQDEGFYRQLWETIRRGEIWQGEICNRRKDGTYYDEYMTVAPVCDGGGTIRHFVAIKEDVTERKRLEQQLARTQRLESIGLLSSGLAHDLNNVLTPILLSVELLRNEFPSASSRRFVDTVQAAAQRGAGIVGQVLTFARGAEGGQRAEVQPRYLIKDVVQLIEETFPRNIRVLYKVSADVSPVHGDITQLHQVVLNLAVNARDAMPQGGVLSLTACNLVVAAADPARPGLKAGPYVVMEIADTGSGIAPEVLEHIFEPFYTTKPRGKGTGLGLSTVYGIVRSHGGLVQVKTELGKGTRFEVLLPASPAKAAGGETPVVPKVVQGRGRRVLVVDDEESIRQVTLKVLERHGFAPVLARDGIDGLVQYQRAPAAIAVAIIDMMMPRMNGAQLVRAIREIDPALPVVISTGLLSAESEPNVEEDLRSMGVKTFLHKPYTEDELLRALDSVLGAGAGLESPK